MNASRLVAKQYFEQGSIRNSAHDEEFFNYFLQYLEEAIRKLKEQGGTPDFEDFDNDEQDEYGQENMRYD